jgi:hypothetical protein
VTESPTKETFNSQSEWLDVQKSRQTVEEGINEDEGVKLVLLGSARHREDLDRVQELRDLADRLGIEVCSLSLWFYSLFWIFPLPLLFHVIPNLPNFSSNAPAITKSEFGPSLALL